MGANQFWTISEGKTANEAFDKAVADAKYEHGHGGYSGTIAEKHSFTEISVPVGTDPKDFAQKLLDDEDPRVDDKWGPAGCVKLAEGKWVFFGWASS